MLRWNKGQDEMDADAAPEKPVPTAAPPHLGRSLPELLLSEGQVGQEALDRALAKQRETGAFLGEILVEQGVIDEKSLLSFLAKYCKIPHLSLLDYLIDKEILSLIPKEICLKHRLLPIDKLGRNLTVAMVNPLDLGALEVVRKHCPELRIKPILCAHKHFEIVTGRLFKEGAGDRVELSATSLGLKMRPSAVPQLDPEPAEEPPPKEAPAPAPPPAPDPEPEPVVEEAIPDAEEVPEAVEADVAAPEQTEESASRESDAWISEVFRENGDEGGGSGDGPGAEEAVVGDASSAMMREMASVMMDSMRDTYAVLSRRMDLFRGLKPEDVARIFACGATVEFEEGAVIFEKGQPGHAMYVVLGGEIVIEDEGRELAVLGRGGMFGEMGLLADAPRSAAARARTFASCLELSKEVIQNLATPEVSNQLLLNVIATLSQRLRIANERPEA